MIKNLVIPREEINFLSYIEKIFESIPSWEEERKFAVTMALNETLVNARKHGGKETIEVIYRASDSKLTVLVQDRGEGFKVEEIPDPTHEDNINLPYGRGLLIVRQYADLLGYHKGSVTLGFYRVKKEKAEPKKIPERGHNYFSKLTALFRRQ